LMDETVDMTSESVTPFNEEGAQIPENPTSQSEPEVQDVPNSNKKPNEEATPKLVTINRMIKRRCDSHDHNEKMMVYGMKAKHDKYWENIDNINLMLYTAVVLDARRNLDYVKWVIDDQYNLNKDRELDVRIKETLTSLYEHYATQQFENHSTTFELDDLSSQDLENYDEHDMAVYEFERDVGAQSFFQKKSDLDK
uniref:hAT-like transposase RNase-H fold domain-containing protein n=1 Tax=Chenopodium quinoa TaxID=63459 RepID=A0A803MZM3_CHEQI